MRKFASILGCLGLVASFAVAASARAVREWMVSSAVRTPDPNQRSVDPRGAALRKALQLEFDSLRRSGGLKGGLDGIDVSAVVRPYIPVGMSFAEAAIILRSAGLTLSDYPNLDRGPDQNSPFDWYAVVARLSPFHSALVWKADLFVSLLPRSPGDYGAIKDLRAAFYLSML